MALSMARGTTAIGTPLERRGMVLGLAALLLTAPSALAQSPQSPSAKGPALMPLGPMRFQVKDVWHGMQQLTLLYTVDANEETQNTIKRNRQAIQDRLNTAVNARMAQDFGGVRGHELLKEILRDEVFVPLRIFPNEIFLTQVTLARRS
jgi:hypothetical protein